MKKYALLFESQSRCNFSIFLKYFFFYENMSFQVSEWTQQEVSAQTVSGSLQILVLENNLDMI